MNSLKSALAILLCSNVALAQNDTLRKVHIGFTYPLSTNGQDARHISNGGSFHALAGVSAGEQAFCFSGISNVIAHNANGFIFAGVANITGGNTNGMQMAGVVNVMQGNMNGFQLAGFSNVARNSKGFQMAGFSNIVKDSAKGLQLAGFINIADKANSQFGGFANIAKSSDGAQVSGFTNVSKYAKGVQVTGFANIAKDVDGVQVAGFINVAKKVKGAQLGFINIAESCDYPIGLVNIIKKGEMHLGLTIDETGTTLAAFRSGSKKMYGILGLGLNVAEPRMRYGLEGGLGLHFPLSMLFRINTELAVLSLSDFTHGVYMKSSLRVLPAMKFGRSFEIFAGPTFSFSNAPQTLSENFNLAYVWERRSKGTFYGMNIGAMAGLQVRL